MATTPVNLNGTTYFIPQPGERGPTYDQDLTNYLIALATAFPQGGASPGSTFQALISAGANPATAGRIRLAFADLFEWRNFANTGNLILELVNGGATNGDNLAFVDTSGNTNLLTGNPALLASTSVATVCTNSTTTTIPFATVATDTDSAFVGGTGIYTVPAGKGGRYYVHFHLEVVVPAATAINMDGAIQVNGSTLLAFGPSAHTTDATQVTQNLDGGHTVAVVPGNTISIGVINSTGTNRSLSGSAGRNILMIQKLS